MIAANNGRRGVFGVDLVAVAFHSEHGQGAKLSLWCCMVSRSFITDCAESCSSMARESDEDFAGMVWA